MAFQQFPGLVTIAVLAALAGSLAGCTFSRAPATSLQSVDQPQGRLSPADALTSTNGGQTASPVSPEPNAPDAAQTPPSPLAQAMIRADSHYERGIQAMRSGNANQAEWEFDAALETLVDTGVASADPPRLVGIHHSPPVSLHDWLSPSLRPQRDVSVESALPDPDEPTQETPTLLDPEDVQAIGAGAFWDAVALPEPDIQKYEFPVVFNEQVKTFIQYFQTKKSGVISRGFERASRYLPMMRQTFREKGLPEELLNLAFIESAVNPWATSRAKAAGIWQFMAPTARLYGMQVSWWIDERRDPEKATRGAAAYLSNLYQMFGDWELALAAYNAGEGAVQRAIDRQRTRNFWALRLPKETQLFVPAFMAMTIISKEPERYGFSPPPDQALDGETVTLDHPADFRTLAQVAGVSVDQLRELNPALIRWTTPPGARRHSLRVPAGVKADFLEGLARIPPHQRVAWITHRVRPGETVSGIAKRHGTNVQALLEMNGLKKRPALKAGGSLFVPASAATLAMANAGGNADRGGTKVARAKAKHHLVKKGETVGQIARTYGVSRDDLQRANGLSRNVSLRPGQALKVPPSSPQEASSAARKRLASSVARPLSTPPAERHYTVKPGDTVAEIARAQGVSHEDLRRWNGLSRQAPLRAGQVLRILAAP